MKKLLATLALAFFTTACAQTGSSQSVVDMQCKCCQEMMKEGKKCCCMGMMDSDMKMDMGKKDGKMQCQMRAKMKEGKAEKPMSNPAAKTAPDEHEQHH